MAAHLFNESGQMQEVDIPDIFDVLEGGEDESAVKFLLGFNAEDAASESANEILNNNGLVQQVLTAVSANSPTSVVASAAASVGTGGLLSTASNTSKTLSLHQDKTGISPARVVVQIEPPTSGLTSAAAATASNLVTTAGSATSMTATDLKTEKTRKREPVDPSRCIYACESCGKAFTTKFNLKRHINMHCSRSREAGVPIQGPPSASQPSRKHKSSEVMSVNVSPGGSAATVTGVGAVTGATQMKVRRVSTSSTASGSVPSVVAISSTASPTMPTLVKTVPVQVTASSASHGAVTAGQLVSKSAYQEPMTVQLAVNAQGQLTSVPTNHRTLTSAAIPVTQAQPPKPSLPVQPLPESAVQIIQSLGGAVTVAGSGSGPVGSLGANHRIVRVINAPQIIATQSRAGITTGATVQLQAIPVSQAAAAGSGPTGTAGTTLTFPQQPLPLVQQIGTRQIVLTTANNGRLATPSITAGHATAKTTVADLQQQQHTTHHIIAGGGAGGNQHQLTTLDSNKINIIPVTSTTSPATSISAADLIYRSIVSGGSKLAGIGPTSPGSAGLTPLQAVVTSSTISSPTCGFNDGPPADLFDSEDGDALSVATTTETPTPPPSLNGDPILALAPITAAIKSLPSVNSENANATITTNTSGEKVVVIQQQHAQNHQALQQQQPSHVVQLNPAIATLVGQPTHDSVLVNNAAAVGGENSSDNFTAAVVASTASASAAAEDDSTKMPTLPSNRFHGQLTSIPKGWLRKVVTTSKGFQKVFYYNPVGKRFSSQEEIDQYFARLGYSVPMSLFNFELPKLVDEDDDEDDDDPDGLDDLDEASTVNNKTMVVKVTSNAKGEATVTPTTSTIVALPSGTIVTRADTTVVDVSRTTYPTAQSQPSLVTSTKPLITTSHAKVMTIGLANATAAAAASAAAKTAGTATTST